MSLSITIFKDLDEVMDNSTKEGLLWIDSNGKLHYPLKEIQEMVTTDATQTPLNFIEISILGYNLSTKLYSVTFYRFDGIWEIPHADWSRILRARNQGKGRIEIRYLFVGWDVNQLTSLTSKGASK